MSLTFISELGIRISQSMVDLFNWLTQTTVDGMLAGLSENGLLGWLTSELLGALASFFELFGYETDRPVFEFFFLCATGILVIWLLDLLRRIIF